MSLIQTALSQKPVSEHITVWGEETVGTCHHAHTQIKSHGPELLSSTTSNDQELNLYIEETLKL